MHFSSISFLCFLALAIGSYSICKAKFRSSLLLALSLFWYATFNPLWIVPLVGSALLSYWLTGRGAESANDSSRGRYFLLSIASSLAVLFLYRWFGPELQWNPLRPPQSPEKLATQLWITPSVPLGLNFVCFLLISYSLDVWRGHARAARSFPGFLLFVSFFPKLANGPLEKYRSFSEQMERLGPLSSANLSFGLTLFIWGFFKKFYAADALIHPVRAVVASPESGAFPLLIAGLLSTFQVYADFSGYCDMGRGLARCLGIELSLNFRPFYFARNPQDFWQRWNISLGNWVRDYALFPLIFRLGRKVPAAVLVASCFLLVGLWHGSSPSWIVFGAMHGLAVAAYLLIRNRSPMGGAVTGLLLLLPLYCLSGLLHWADQTGGLKLISALASEGSGSALTISMMLRHATPYLLPVVAMECLWVEKKGDNFFRGMKPVPRWIFISFCLALPILFNRSSVNPFSYL